MICLPPSLNSDLLSSGLRINQHIWMCQFFYLFSQAHVILRIRFWRWRDRPQNVALLILTPPKLTLGSLIIHDVTSRYPNLSPSKNDGVSKRPMRPSLGEGAIEFLRVLVSLDAWDELLAGAAGSWSQHRPWFPDPLGHSHLAHAAPTGTCARACRQRVENI